MSKEGYWLNPETSVYVEVDEHVLALIDMKVTMKLGLTRSTVEKVKRLNWQTDRVEVLLLAMRAGLVRVRGHGTSVTCEYVTGTKVTLPAIRVFLKKTGVCGPQSSVVLNNLRTKETVELRYPEFVRLVDEDPLKVMRQASTSRMNYDTGTAERKVFGSVLEKRSS